MVHEKGYINTYTIITWHSDMVVFKLALMNPLEKTISPVHTYPASEECARAACTRISQQLLKRYCISLVTIM